MFNWSGSMNMTGATKSGGLAGRFSSIIQPSSNTLNLFSAQANSQNWSAVGPASTIGTGSATIFASSRSGTTSFGLQNSSQIKLRENYVSGSDISGTATYNSNTFSSLGLNLGTYVWTMAGSNDTVTLSVIPEPSTTALAGLACGLVLFRRRGA